MVTEYLSPETDDRDDRIRALEQTLESLRADSEVAHVLLGLSAALAEVRTVEETLERAVRMVPELCGADRCFAAIWDAVNERFVIRALAGYDEAGEKVIRDLAGSKDGLPLLMEALDSGVPLLVDDVSKDEKIPADHVDARRLGAYIGLPLLRWGEGFGALGIEYSRPKAFAPKDSALARGIARQVGVALANARRFNLLQGLRAFGLRVGARLSLSAVVSEIAEGAKNLLSGDGSALYFLDSQHRELVSSGTRGLLPDTVEKLNRLDLAIPPWNVLEAGETVMVPDLTSALGENVGPAFGVLAGIPGSEAPLLGAVGVFFKQSVAIGHDESEALNVLAAQAGTAIENAQRFERQRRVARSLQQGLMSTEMPDIKTFQIGAIYEAASSESEVGGDFFDVFELTDGQVALVVGDVAGKGAEAAAQTAMAKYMLRAFAMRNASPSSVLFHLNNALVQGLPDDRFTTAMYGILDPEKRVIQMASGGHPPALVYRHATGEVEIYQPDGAIIGAFEDQQYEAADIRLEPGDVFLAFTDGLPEARAEDDLYGRDRIVASFKKHAAVKSARGLARSIYEDASTFGSVSDDTVVFALKCGSG